LELDDWIAARSGHAKQGLGEQSAQALGEEGSAEERGGVLVLIGALTLIDLPEIGGELGLLIAARGDIRMGRDYFSPGLQATLRLALGRLERPLAHFGATLLVEDEAHQVHP